MNGNFFLTLCLAVVFSSSRAQQFGAFPPSTRWQQINSDTARVIFDNKVASQAQRIAAIVHRISKEDKASLGGAVRKINILLHPNTTQANGYVALGPFRSEFYLIPSSDIFRSGATPWNEDLAVHEFRHVQQYSNFNKGLSKVAGFVLGQQGQALFNALAIPDWFFEGDAVHSETAFTAQGRGRTPNFFNGYRALWRDQRNYNWMKLRNGSLKDYVPNHYQLGYLLTNYGYEKYGSEFWGKVTDDAARFRSPFYPFQKAVKRVSGKDFTAFRNEAIKSYKHDVSTRRDRQVRRETVADYLFPQAIGEDSLLYIKQAYNSIPAFYVRDKTGEHRIGQRNISSEDWLSYRDGTIAYTAYAVHPRWGLTDYSNIYLFNISTKAETRLTTKEKYFTPDLSPDGNSLVAVAFTDSAENELHLLNREGSLVKKIAPPKAGDLYVHPRFATAETIVVAVRHADASMSLQLINVAGGSQQIKPLISPTFALIGYPFVEGNTVYFVSSVSGNDDIYSLRLTDPLPAEKLVQHTTGVTGHYYPSVYCDSLLFSTFTSNGLRIGGVGVGARKLGISPTVSIQSRILPYKVAMDGSTTNVLTAAGYGNYPVKRYPQTKGLFNFHSRQATYTDPEITASIFSDNILNTFSNEIFYRYNRNELSHAVGINSYYGGFFPVLTAGYNYTFNRTFRTTARTLTLDQQELQAGYYIPLNFTQGKTFKSFTFGTNYVYNQTTPTGDSKRFITGRNAGYLHHFVNLTQQLPRAVQQIFPKFGYTIRLAHRHLLGDNGFQALGGTVLYLPSIKNHSIVLSANWQETDTSNVIFSNRFANSRGYYDYFLSRMWRLSGNYHLPLVYPDWGFGNIVYFLRVRGNAFYDLTRVYSRNKQVSRDQRSVGGEIYFDTRWWNSLPVSFGFRISRLLDDDIGGQRRAGGNVFEFILPVDLIPR
jgi:hypothetical protein